MEKNTADIKLTSPRIPAIDALRGVAVVLMVQQHLGVWLWDHAGKSVNAAFSDYPWYIIINWLGNLAAPLFVVLAGVGTVLFENRHEHPDKSFMVRGGIILLFGYGLNILCPHWFSLSAWYVLHLIGFALALTPLFRRLPDITLLPLVLLLTALAAMVQTCLNTPLYLSNKHMGSAGLLWHALAVGHFPVLPWCGFFLLGILLGRWLKREKYNPMIILALFFIGAAATLGFLHRSGFAFATYGYFYRLFVLIPYFYPPLPPFILLLMGVTALLFFFFSGALTPEKPVTHSLSRANCRLAPLGRLPLTILIGHAVIFNELFRFLGLHGVFTAPVAVLIIALTLLCLMTMASLWRVYGFKYSLEWLMRKVSG